MGPPTATIKQRPGAGGASSTHSKKPPLPDEKEAKAPLAGEELTPMQVFRKALTPNGRWTKDTFPQFLDVVYWFRQLLAILVGFVWGRAGSRGAPAIISWVGLNIMLPRAYYAQYARVDEEDFDPLNLMKEGFQPSFGLFMFTWIAFYNAYHGGKLAELAAEAAAAAAGGGK